MSNKEGEDMKRENLAIVKEVNVEPASFDIDSLEEKLYSSRLDIQRLKKILQNCEDKKLKFLNQLNDLQEAATKVNAKLPLELKETVRDQNQNNALIQTVSIVDEIRHYLKLIRMEEGKLKLDRDKKDRLLKDFKLQKNYLVKEIADYKQLNVIHEQRTRYLETALNNKKRMMEKKTIKAEQFQNILIESYKDQIMKLNSTVRKHEQTINYYKNQSVQINTTLYEKNVHLASVEKKLIRLMETKTRHHNLMKEIEVEYQDIREKWANIGLPMPIQEEQNLNNIKRGSWIQLFWNWWNNESQTQYLVKTEEVQNTIKELQLTLSTYENLLEKMNSHFDRYKQNEQEFAKEIMELKEQMQVLIDMEEEYLKKAEKQENELLNYKDQNFALEQKLKEMEIQAEEYKAKVEQLKKKDSDNTRQINKTIQSLQEREKRYAEQFQRTMTQPQGRADTRRPGKTAITAKAQRQLSSPANSKLQKRNIQLNQMSKAQQKSQNKLDLIKKFYPQAQSQSSIFNPFKY